MEAFTSEWGHQNGEYSFRPYAAADRDGVLELFRACFGKDRQPVDWNWMYHDSPYGESSVVVEFGKELVGFYGVIHRPVFFRGEEMAAGHVLDVMTHPSHQGRGLFTAAAKVAFAIARAKGIKLFFGFPNMKALPGHRKVGWKELGTRSILMHPCEGNPRAPRELDPALSITEQSTQELPDLAREMDRIFHLQSRADVAIGDRRCTWLSWRYSRPGFGYRLVTCFRRAGGELAGWAVVRKKEFEGRSVGHIVDWLCIPGEERVLHEIERWAVDRFVSSRCSYVQCLDNREACVLQPSLDGWRPERSRELMFIVRSTDENGGNPFRAGPERWYLSLGDCDVF